MRPCTEKPNLYLYDVISSYFEGIRNELGIWIQPGRQERQKQIVVGLHDPFTVKSRQYPAIFFSGAKAAIPIERTT